jgi:hypothetical protein
MHEEAFDGRFGQSLANRSPALAAIVAPIYAMPERSHIEALWIAGRGAEDQGNGLCLHATPDAVPAPPVVMAHEKTLRTRAQPGSIASQKASRARVVPEIARALSARE